MQVSRPDNYFLQASFEVAQTFCLLVLDVRLVLLQFAYFLEHGATASYLNLPVYILWASFVDIRSEIKMSF